MLPQGPSAGGPSAQPQNLLAVGVVVDTSPSCREGARAALMPPLPQDPQPGLGCWGALGTLLGLVADTDGHGMRETLGPAEGCEAKAEQQRQ